MSVVAGLLVALAAFLGSVITTTALTLWQHGAKVITFTDEEWEQMPRHPGWLGRFIRYDNRRGPS